MEKKIHFEGKYLRLAQEGNYEYVERVNSTGVAVIIPFTDEGELVLVQQYRAALHTNVLELPAGLVGDEAARKEEAMKDAALRELEEETGYTATTLEQICHGPVTPGMSSEKVTFFKATGLSRVHMGGGVDDENITVHHVKMADAHNELSRLQASGLMLDPKIYIAFAFF